MLFLQWQMFMSVIFEDRLSKYDSGLYAYKRLKKPVQQMVIGLCNVLRVPWSCSTFYALLILY